MKEIPISKVYEALSAIADKRVHPLGNGTFVVVSSDYSKGYTVTVTPETASSNDNATVWQHYAGYPILAVWMYTGFLSYENTFLEYFRSIPWKALNTRFRNDYERSIEEAFSSLDSDKRAEISSFCESLRQKAMTGKVVIKGSRKPLWKPEDFSKLS